MRIRQIVFAAQDLARSRALLQSVLALPEPFRDPGVAEFGIDNAVFTFGDQFIEVISPTRDDSACSRHLARHGDSGYMLLLQTDDFSREQARWADLGVRTIWSTRYDDITAAHLHPKDVGAAIVSVDEPRPAASWRWGGPDWQVQPGDAGRQRVRGVTVRARDAQAMAQRWAQVFDGPMPLPAGEGWRLTLDGGQVDFEPAGDAAEGLAGFRLEAADPAAVRARAQKAGLALDAHGNPLLCGCRLDLQALPARNTAGPGG